MGWGLIICPCLHSIFDVGRYLLVPLSQMLVTFTTNPKKITNTSNRIGNSNQTNNRNNLTIRILMKLIDFLPSSLKQNRGVLCNWLLTVIGYLLFSKNLLQKIPKKQLIVSNSLIFLYSTFNGNFIIHQQLPMSVLHFKTNFKNICDVYAELLRWLSQNEHANGEYAHHRSETANKHKKMEQDWQFSLFKCFLFDLSCWCGCCLRSWQTFHT